MTNTQPPPPNTVQPAAPYAPYGTTPNGAPLAPRTNTLAIIALVLSLTVPIGGIICGHIALNQIKRTGEGGHGLALAGTIIGWAYTGLTVIILIAYAIFFAALFSSGVFTPGTVI
jgi:hypothetical protein